MSQTNTAAAPVEMTEAEAKHLYAQSIVDNKPELLDQIPEKYLKSFRDATTKAREATTARLAKVKDEAKANEMKAAQALIDDIRSMIDRPVVLTTGSEENGGQVQTRTVTLTEALLGLEDKLQVRDRNTGELVDRRHTWALTGARVKQIRACVDRFHKILADEQIQERKPKDSTAA